MLEKYDNGVYLIGPSSSSSLVVVGRRPVVMSTATRFSSLCRRVANRNSKRQSVREYSSRYETDMLDIKTQMASKKKTKHARPNRKRTCGAGWRNIRSSKYQTISNQNSKSFRIARARTHVASRPEQQRRTFIFSLLASLVLSTSSERSSSFFAKLVAVVDDQQIDANSSPCTCTTTTS